MSFLRRLLGLGPSQEEAWRRLASELGAKFVKGGFWRGQAHRVVAEVKEWTITLDTYRVASAPPHPTYQRYTRVVAPYVTMAHLQVKRSPDGTPMARRTDGKSLTPEDREAARRLVENSFQFRVSRKGFFGAAMKLLLSEFLPAPDTRTLEVGDPDFDRNFVIEGNDRSKVQALFANLRIRQLIQQQPSLNLWVEKHKLFCELYFQEDGVIKDVIRLKSLFELFEETLNHLCRTG